LFDILWLTKLAELPLKDNPKLSIEFDDL
jgi:hypothetical protein